MIMILEYTKFLNNKILKLGKELREYENLYHSKDKECSVLEEQLKKKDKALSLSTFLVVAEAVIILLMVWL